MSHLRFRMQFFLWAIFIILLTGTLGFKLLEGLSLVDAFYFSIVTITTVGYGDIHPVTAMGKALAVFLIITGVGTFLGVIASATDLILTEREQKARLEKLNVIIGVFFSEVGTKLLADFSKSDTQTELIRNNFIININWSDKDFNMVSSRLNSLDFSLDMGTVNLKVFHNFLEDKSNFLLRIMENPNLLEHEAFTDLLMTVFHLK